MSSSGSKQILMIAFHFPPCRGSSGLQRTLSFVRYLPRHGWAPLVLTTSPRAYPQIGDDQLSDIPTTVPIKRAFALDAARHLAFKGRYLKGMALPDCWVSWFFSAVPMGLRLALKHKPKIIWSTYPIGTAHIIALALHRLTGIPWIADFRDPMTETDPATKERFPKDPSLWKARRWIEQLTVKHCARAVFTTEGARRLYSKRYASLPSTRWMVISNGYDEEYFAEVERLAIRRRFAGHPIVLLHSGILYPTRDRDPTHFFTAVAKLQSAGKINSSGLRIVLRGSGYEDEYRKRVCDKGIENIVSLEPAIPYRDALAEMLNVDGLLLFQGYTSNPAIPAKLYEYLRARRPIFAMVDSQGDTAHTLQQMGVGQIVPLDSEDLIVLGLLEFLRQIQMGKGCVASESVIRDNSRESVTRQLATTLDEVC
jgi:glycosyltransferase involved in cell wall biosynthesis